VSRRDERVLPNDAVPLAPEVTDRVLSAGTFRHLAPPPDDVRRHVEEEVVDPLAAQDHPEAVSRPRTRQEPLAPCAEAVTVAAARNAQAGGAGPCLLHRESRRQARHRRPGGPGTLRLSFRG